MTRRQIGYLILVAWGLSLAWLVARRVFTPPEERVARAAARLGPSASFYGVFLGDGQVGTAGITLDTLPMGFRLLETITLDVRDEDGPVRLMARTEGTTFRGFGTRDATISLVDGRRNTRVLELATDDDTTMVLRFQRQPRGVDVVRGLAQSRPLLSSIIPFQLAAQGRLRNGASIGLETVHPLHLARVHETVRVGRDSLLAVSDTAAFDSTVGRWAAVAEEPVTAWWVERIAGGPPLVEWVDGQGRVLRRSWAFGLTLERSPFEVNFTNYQAVRRADFDDYPPRLTGLRRSGPAPAEPAASPTEVVLARTDGPAWPGAVATLAGGRQSVRADTVRIDPSGPLSDAEPPTQGRNIHGLSEGDLAVLRTALDEALGSNPPEDTLAALVSWVAQDVRYSGHPLAAIGGGRAARERRAGPEGKAHLLVALSGLAGLPARVVSGIDLAGPDLPAHTWVEVWRRGWLAVDPLRGEVPARTTLLRIFEGAVHPLAMALQIGALRATVVPNAGTGGRP